MSTATINNQKVVGTDGAQLMQNTAPSAPPQKETHHPFTPQEYSPGHRASQGIGKVWDAPDNIQKLAGVNEVSSQSGAPVFFDQMPGHLAANNHVWMAAWDTERDGKEDHKRYYLAHLNQLEEGTIVIVPGRGPQMVQWNQTLFKNELVEVPTKPKPGEVIVAGVEPSRRQVRIRERRIGEGGKEFYVTRDIHLVAGYYTTSLTDGSTKILKDGDRAIFYRKNQYQQYLNKDGNIILIDRQGNLTTKDNWRGIPLDGFDIRKYAAEDTTDPKTGKEYKLGEALPPHMWRFFVTHPGSGDKAELMDSDGNVIRPGLVDVKKVKKDSVDGWSFTFKSNKHGHVVTEDGKVIVMHTKHGFRVQDEDPSIRMKYRPAEQTVHHTNGHSHTEELQPVAFRRLEFFEVQSDIERFGSPEQKERIKVLKKAVDEAASKREKKDNQWKLDEYVRSIIGSPLPDKDGDREEGVQYVLDDNMPGLKHDKNGKAIRRYLEGEYKPVVIEQGLWIKDAMAIEDPTRVMVNHQPRRGFLHNNHFTRNTKDVLVFKNEVLEGGEWDKLVIRNPEGRVSGYYHPEDMHLAAAKRRKFTPGYIKDENGQNVLLTEEPDFTFGGNNRRLRKYFLDSNNQPQMTWRRVGTGDQVDGLFGMCWHPQDFIQDMSGAQNSGGSNRFMLRSVYGYQMHETAWRAIENSDKYMSKPGQEPWIRRDAVPVTEPNPFFRDEMYKHVTPVAVRSQRIFNRHEDDYTTVREIYSHGIGSTIRHDAAARLKLGVLETLGLTGVRRDSEGKIIDRTYGRMLADWIGIEQVRGYRNEDLGYHSKFQTIYMAPAGAAIGAVAGLAMATSLTTAATGILAGAAIGGVVAAAITAPLYYHYIYDQSARRKNICAPEILQKNYRQKSIWEGKEDHSKFLIGLRDDLYEWFWNGYGLQQYFATGGVDGRRDLSNKFWTETGVSVTCGAAMLGSLAVAAVANNIGGWGAYFAAQQTLLGSAAAMATASSVAAGTVTTLALAGAAVTGLGMVGLAGMAAMSTVKYRMNKHSELDAFVYAYSDSKKNLDAYANYSETPDEVKRRIDREYRTKDGEASMGMDFVRDSVKEWLTIKFKRNNTPVTQTNMARYLRDISDTSFRLR